MIVTIERELGAGGLSVGEAVAQEIGAALLDEHAIVRELAARGGFSASYLRDVDERAPSFADAFVSDLARAGALMRAEVWKAPEVTVLYELRDVVLERAALGNVVLIGHGGPQLLGSQHDDATFSILLHAERSVRERQVMARFAISREAASARIARTDERRRKFLTHFFKTELYDARAYDLVLNTGRMGLEASIAIARGAVRAALDASHRQSR